MPFKLPFFRSKKEKVCLFGINAGNLSIAKSAEKAKILFYGSASVSDKQILRSWGMRFSPLSPTVAVRDILMSAAKGKGTFTVILNTGDEAENIRIASLFAVFISAFDNATKEDLFRRLSVHIFCDTEKECSDLMQKGCGCIHIFRPSRAVAEAFTAEYPLARFLDARHIDYTASLLRERTDLRVFFVGFDEVASAIYQNSVANDRFFAASPTGAVPRTVSYHIYDPQAEEKMRSLTDTCLRYRINRPALAGKDCLPLPLLPSEEVFFTVDLETAALRELLSQNLLYGDQDACFVIVSAGNDAENLSLARRILSWKRSLGASFTVFVRLSNGYEDAADLTEEGCILFGCEQDAVYRLDAVKGGVLTRMAMMRNEIYAFEYAVTHLRVAPNSANFAESRRRSEEEWHLSSSELNRLSSRYGCLSIRSKLNLMGLDCLPGGKTEQKTLSEEEYLAIYAAGDPLAVRGEIEGKKILRYTLDFPLSRRRTLAEQEHDRWNAFMFVRGYIPATRDEILTATVRRGDKEVYSNGKDPVRRLHGNLTTFDGLVTYRQMIAARDGTSEESADVIKYDYQLMDDAYWLLTQNGYRIVYLHPPVK